MTDIALNTSLSDQERAALIKENAIAREDAIRAILGDEGARQFRDFRATIIYFPIAENAASLAKGAGEEIPRAIVYDLAAIMKKVGYTGLPVSITTNPTPSQANDAAAMEQTVISNAAKILTPTQLAAFQQALASRIKR